MTRWAQSTLLAAMLVVSWLGMQAVHELGHVLAAWATGGRVVRVVLHPLTISRTDVWPNPDPLAVAWGGPLVGALLPLTASTALRRTQTRRYADFFAGFCLIANGAYIGLGSIGSVGDAGEMLRRGSRNLWLAAFGVVAVLAGLWIWHRASGEFGFGRRPRQVGSREAVVAALIAASAASFAAIFGSR